jgi:trimeric autotransporter adhesin
MPARFSLPSNSGRFRKVKRAVSQRLRVERLEDRSVPAVITVNTTLDTIAVDGLASLREAITSINNQADVNGDVTLARVGGYASLPGGTPDVINFDIPAAGVQTISATAAEPTIVRSLTINGYSQTGASTNTLANADNAVILIQLDGTSAGASIDGLTLGSGSGGSIIEGLDITNFSGNGIVIQSNGNSILGNFIGVDPAGTSRMPNGTFPTSGDGIRILNASNNQIGSTSPADRNIVSGNAIDGIHIEGTLAAPATGNIIQGNFVGVAADGKSSVGNRTEPAPAPGTAEGNNLFGIEISGGNMNTIGGTSAGARNIVGLNGGGIDIDNGSQQNVIQGNFVGVGADGVTHAGNLLHGIDLRSSNGFSAPLGPAQPNEPGVSSNLIGGTVAGAGNLVEFNGSAGVAVFGNPVSASGQPNIGNTIEGNSIFQNGQTNPTTLIGIDLSNGFLFPKDDGVTPNDSKGHGAANDPNNFQNFPVLTSAMAGPHSIVITGSIDQSVSPNTTFRIEFFASQPIAGAIAEGQTFLGFKNVTTDASGHADFTIDLAENASLLSQIVTATATDPVGNTSEFSAGIAAVALLRLAIGTGAGQEPQVNVFEANPLNFIGGFDAFARGFLGGVRVAVGDVNGDGVPDIIVAAGPGGGPHVKVVDGTKLSQLDLTTGEIKDSALLGQFYAYDPRFSGGVFVAFALSSMGLPEIITGADAGGGPHVKVIDGTKLNQLQNNAEIADSALVAQFYAYDPGFAGGVRVAAADLNGDGVPDIVTGAGPGGGPHVKAIDGTKLDQLQNNAEISDSALLGQFYAYGAGFNGGVFVAANSNSGHPLIVTGAGAGNIGPEVKVIDAAKLFANPAGQVLVSDFFAYDPQFAGGVTLGAAELTGDAAAEIITGAGPGSQKIKVIDGTQLNALQLNREIADSALIDNFMTFDPGFTGGVFVGAGG